MSGGCTTRQIEESTYVAIQEEVQRGKLGKALHDADAANQKYGRSRPETSWRFRILKAHVLFFCGSYRDSLQLLSEELPPSLTRSDLAARRDLVRGLDETYLQQLDEADRDLRAAAEIAESSKQSGLGLDISQARGILELYRQKYSDAEVAFRMTLTMARQQNRPSRELGALGNLGNAAMWEEHYDEAIDWFKLALQKSQSLREADTEAKTLGNIGWNYAAIGDFNNAEEMLKRAEQASAEASSMDDHVRWLNGLGDVYGQQGRFDEAEKFSQGALSFAQKMDNKRNLVECLNTLSALELGNRRVDLAEGFNRQAVDAEGGGKDQYGVANTQLMAGRIATVRGDFSLAEQVLRKISGDAGAGTALHWQAQAGLAQVYALRNLPNKAEREFQESISTISKAWGEIEHEEFKFSFLSSAIRFYDAYVNFLIDRNRPLDALKIADLSRAQTLERGLSSGKNGKVEQSASLRPEEIAKRLNATLLFYWLGEERSHLWVITAKGVSLLPLPGRGGIDAAVKAYLDSFTDPRDPLETENADAKKLYVTLIQPAEKLIPKNSRVILLPDRGLNSLNFETLIVPGPKPHYWIEDVTLTIANSLSLLSRTSLSAPPETTSLLLMGDALFASPDFPPLPQAGKEVGLVESYFPKEGRTVLAGAQATASHFLSGKPETFSYLHFATHGTASTSHPLESAVILSPEGDSYKLYARDIVQHPLHAYLVTISACNGSGLRTYAGEGLVGLAWAFLRAGAHNVIGGLWEVSNASTPQLMDELYKGLSAGKDPASALREAKLTLVHSKGNYRRPFYWGPFQLYAGS